MLWRSDTRQLTVYAATGRYMVYPDQWDGQEVVLSAPNELIAPVRGFGWLWLQQAEVASSLGWAIEEEKGFCLNLQDFEGGIVIGSTSGSCGPEYNRAKDDGFRSVRIRLLKSGTWASY
jgi:hypothetical protein